MDSAIAAALASAVGGTRDAPLPPTMPLIHCVGSMRRRARGLVSALDRAWREVGESPETISLPDLPAEIREEAGVWIASALSRSHVKEQPASVVVRRLVPGACVPPRRNGEAGEVVSIVLTSSSLDGVTEATNAGFVRTPDRAGNVMMSVPGGWSWISPIASRCARYDIVVKR